MSRCKNKECGKILNRFQARISQYCCTCAERSGYLKDVIEDRKMKVLIKRRSEQYFAKKRLNSSLQVN